MEIDKQLEQLVKLQLSEASKKPSLGEKIASMATLLAAITSLIGASWAVYTNFQTSSTQTRIELKQQELDQNDRLVQENSRIGAIWIQEKFRSKNCAQISLGEPDLWDDYAICLAGKKGVEVSGVSDIDFLDYKNYSDRYDCLSGLEVPHCR